MIQAFEEPVALTGKRRDDGGEEKKSIFLLARVDVCVATVVRCFIKNETRGGQRPKVSADTQRGHARTSHEAAHWERQNVLVALGGRCRDI